MISVITSFAYILLGLIVDGKNYIAKMLSASLCFLGFFSALFHYGLTDSMRLMDEVGMYYSFVMIFCWNLSITTKINNNILLWTSIIAMAVLTVLAPIIHSFVMVMLLFLLNLIYVRIHTNFKRWFGILTLMLIVSILRHLGEMNISVKDLFHSIWHITTAIGMNYLILKK